MTDSLLNAAAGVPADVPQDSDVAGVPAADDVTDVASNGEGDANTDNVYTDYALPDGVTLDAQLLEQAVPIFKELGLTKEQSQKLIDIHAAQIQNSIKSQAESLDQLMKDWRTQTEKDSEIGGEKLPETIATARIALDKLGTPELTKLLDEVGIGNNPEMIRFMAKVGAYMRDDSPGRVGGVVSSGRKDRASVLYPNS